MAKGRKRSLCGVLATQRLSKLHKDAAAEANNKLIGRTGLDLDMKRAAEELGMAHSDRLTLRDLKDGEFFAFGPAIEAAGVVRFKSAGVKTTHPKAGQRHKLSAPKPSATIRKVLGQLTDLPQQAAAEIRDMDTALKRIADLERDLRSAARAAGAKPAPVESVKRVEVPIVLAKDLKSIERLLAAADKVAEKQGILVKGVTDAATRVAERSVDFSRRQPSNQAWRIGRGKIGRFRSG